MCFFVAKQNTVNTPSNNKHNTHIEKNDAAAAPFVHGMVAVGGVFLRGLPGHWYTMSD